MSDVVYKMIADFPGYRIGSDGTVLSCWMARGGTGGMRRGGTWRKLRQEVAGSNRYLRVSLGKNGLCYRKFVHVLVLEAFIGPRPYGMVCRHGPLGKYINSVENLSWGTQSQNKSDEERDGTKVRGELHHNAKLTVEVVRQARIEYRDGIDSCSLAVKYGVRQSTMWSALNHKTWRHV